MKLSIFVNLRSIGWVVSNGAQVVDRGIKRVNVDYDTYYEFIAGQPISKRISRRTKRSMRRNLNRRNCRRKALMNMFPNAYTLKLSREEHLKLRVEALERKLTPHELLTVFLQLQKKRGYKNMRGLSNADGSEYLSIIRTHEEELTKYRSIAEYLLTLPTSKGVIFMRESHEAEYDKIAKVQGITDPKVRRAIYFQRPLRKGNVAKCRLERDRKVSHYSTPNYQYFRVLRDVNNIVIMDPYFNEIEIQDKVRKVWVEKLQTGKSLTKAQCCKDIGIMKSTGYSWRSGKQISGNVIANELGSINEELWHDLYSSTDDSMLYSLIKRKYPDLDPELLLEIDFRSYGWGEYSNKAIKKLIPHLENGLPLREAIINEYGLVDLTADMSLRNLVVEQHFASYKSLVEAIKQTYEIDETAIEISTLLKVGNKARKAMAKSERAERKADKSISDYQRHLLKLAEEFQNQSPYEPGKIISRDDLFSNYNIDHIVPKSKLFEHGKINQCLCRKDLNELKGSMTGIEFAKSLGIEEKYIQLIDNLKLSEQKRRFLLMHTEDIPTDYIESNDYITRCFATLANYVIPFKIINKYCKDWQWNNFPDNDVRNSLHKAFVIANFNTESIDYFNNLKTLGDASVGRYNISPSIEPGDISDVVPYIPRIKFYRKTKYGIIPRFALHDESVMGKRQFKTRDSKGNIKTVEKYKIRKPVTSLTAPMVGRIMDKAIREKIEARLKDRDFAEAMQELAENPVSHNGKPVKSVSIYINANELIKIPRGYVYSSMNQRYEPETGKLIKLFDYIKDLNAGVSSETKSIKRNDVFFVDGQYYYVIGASSTPELRSVYELNAIGIRTNKAMMQRAKQVRVSQLGVVKYE